MSCRIMRIIIFFDLPTLTVKDMLEYRRFRKFLITNGFIMMQESIYCRLVLNNNSTKLLRTQIIKNLPSKGLVQMLQVTEKQFASMEYLKGGSNSKVIDSMDKVVYL